MIFLIFFIITVNSFKYSWTLDKLNQISHIPDFYSEYKNDQHERINTNVYVIDSGIINSKYFYDNIYQQKNLINNITKDQIGHGTFVTSQISSKYYGVTKNVNITSIKIFGAEDEKSSSQYLIDALKYVQTDCNNTNNNCVINLSLGLNIRHEPTDKLLETMHDDNFLIIVAAGNDNTDCQNFTPSHLPFLFVVGSFNYLDMRSSFSNYGKCVDIYTYGELVPGIGLNDEITIMSGTSMAAPIMTGYMADYWNLYPNLRNEEIQKKFLDDYSVDRYGYRMFILKNSFFNDVIFIWIINFLSVFLFTLIHLIYFLFKG